MRLKDQQIEGLAGRILRRGLTQGLIELKGSEAQVLAAITELLHQFNATSRAVDEAAKKLMNQYAAQIQSGQVDSQKMFGMIKKQVAKEKGFDLDADDQVSRLAHQIQDRLYEDDLVDSPEMERALRQLKETLRETLCADEVFGERVREKIRSLKRGVAEGSAEWQILYEKYLEEELAKKGF